MTGFRWVRQWLWLIGLCAALAGGGSALVGALNSLEEQYTAQVRLVWGYPLPSYRDDEEFRQMMIDLSIATATDPDVLQAVIDAGHFNLSVVQLAAMVRASPVERTSLVTLQVTHTDPVLVVEIADEVARQLMVELNKPWFTPEESAQIELVYDEIERLRGRSDDAGQQLRDVQQQLSEANPRDDIAQLKQDYDALIERINTDTSTIAALQSALAQMRGHRGWFIEIVESAHLIGLRASYRNILRDALIVALAGGALGLGIALLVDVRSGQASRRQSLVD